MEIKKGTFKCEQCHKMVVIKEQFVQEKDNEITLLCPWCKKVLGTYTSYKNIMYIVEKAKD